MDTVRGNPNCEDCVLHRTAQYVCLMGRGRVPAKVMVVGEAPGQSEDETGKPFQGRSGKLLDSMLDGIGLSRDQVYVTNAVKCRPPENRTPKTAEMKACRPYLETELAEVRPKYVLLLGASAVKQVLKRGKITELHGQAIVQDRITYFPIYHPAAALRNPKLMGPMQQDFKKFRDVLDGKSLEGKAVPYTLIESEEELEPLIQAISKSKEVGFDSETTGLDYNDEAGHINTAGFATDFGNWVLPLSHPRSPFRRKKSVRDRMVSRIVEAFSSGVRPKRVTANNGKFDNNWFMSKYGVRFPLNFDNMLAFHLLDETQLTGLKYLAVAHLGASNYDIPLSIKTGKDHSPESTIKLYQYQAEDAVHSRALGSIAKQKLQEDDALWFLFKNLVMPTARAYETIERNGVFIYRDRLEAYGKELETKRAADLVKLNELVDDHTDWYAKNEVDVNWNSPKQINDILFDRLKLKPRGFTPGGDPSTNETLLNLMKDDHPIISQLLEYRAGQKMLSTYVDGWLSRMKGDYLYPNFKTNGTVTGRPSCEDPNLQATPRDKKLRSLVGAPPGWVFFESDYSQVELRVAAILSGDEEMSRVFLTGGDIHRTTASLISGVPEDEVTDEDRKKAKAVNFGFLYGMGWKKFMDYARDKYGVIVTEREAKAFRKRFFEKFAGLQPWHDRQRRVVGSVAQVRTLTGRIRHLQDIRSDMKGIAAKAERDAINSPVQGFAAEMALMAIVEMDRRFDPNDIKICGTIHDAIIGRVREDIAEEMMLEVKRIMENPPLLQKMGIELPLPIEVEVKLGDWGVGRKLKLAA